MTGRARNTHADLVRQAFADPSVKARTDQDAAARRQKTVGANVRKLRALTAGADPGMDELAMDALAIRIVALVSLDPQANAALIREMLPSYLASRDDKDKEIHQ